MASHTSVRLAGPTPRSHPATPSRTWHRGPDASLEPARDTPSVAHALAAERSAREAGGGTPVNPALARMHERLRERRPLRAGDVPRIDASARADVAAAVATAPDAGRGAGPVTGAPGAGRGADPSTGTPENGGTGAPVSPGLERFMRLRGLSGRTYVFSRIEPRHVPLYRNGIFAWVERGAKAGDAHGGSGHGGSGQARVIGDVLPIVSNAIDDGALYVHLLAQDDGDRADVLTDLQ